MKIQIENLKAQMRGVELNIHQRVDALIEFNKLVDYTESLEIKVENLGIHGVSKRTSVDFKKLRDAYFKEHVTHKTTDGIPMVCTHPHNLFEWFKAELKEYGC